MTDESRRLYRQEDDAGREAEADARSFEEAWARASDVCSSCGVVLATEPDHDRIACERAVDAMYDRYSCN